MLTFDKKFTTMNKISFQIKLLLICFIIVVLPACYFNNTNVTITEVRYKNTPHFKIITPSATYFYEQQSGGFSSIIDVDNKDWVNYKKSDSVRVPQSAAADFRGLPNLVYSGQQNGIGHPGFDKCLSKKMNDSTLMTESKNGNYKYFWTFYPDKAIMKIVKADTSRHYWFLYEGPIAGQFNPQTHFCYTNKGLQAEKPSIFEGNPIKGYFDWICFGDSSSNQLFFIHHITPDKHIDIVTYMGNSEKGNNSKEGMVVMGFGRTPDTKALMQKTPNVFSIGFIEKTEKENADLFSFLKGKIK